MEDYRHIRELKQSAPYIGVYAIFWGCAYLITFWSFFNVNPFQYLGAAEIILQAGIVLFRASIGVIAILCLEAFISSSDPDEVSRTKQIKTLRSRIIIVTAIASIAIYFAQNTPALYGGAIAVTMTLVAPISCTDLFRHSFSSKPVRTAIAALTISLPVSALIAAYSEAKDVLNTKGKLTMIKKPSSTCVNGCVLIGKIGNYFCVRGNNGKFIMIESDEMKQFELYSHDFGE